MRAVVQRVLKANVFVEERELCSIGKGLLVFVAIGKGDNENSVKYMANKIVGLRIFPDNDKGSSCSVVDVNGEILLVSQFTLYGDVRKGKRPSFSDAMDSENAKKFYEMLIEEIKKYNIPVKTGEFQKMMKINLVNDGPYTILLDSDKQF